MSTLIVYSDAADGYLSSYHEGYNAARAGSGVVAWSDLILTIGQYRDTGDDPFIYVVYESFLSFDTSSLTSGATISAATLNLTANQDISTVDFTIEARLYDWGSSLEAGDWIDGATLGNYTLLASKTTNVWVPGTAYDLTSNAAFISNINKTGSTRLSLSSSRTRTGSYGTSSERVMARSADYTGTTSDPKLTVEYTPSGTPALSAKLNRVF